MKAWKYCRGEWTEIEDPLVWNWNKDEEWESVLSRASYCDFPFIEWGHLENTMQLYIKNDDEPPYLITFNLSSSIEHVYIDDMPSLMQWLRDYTPLFSLQQIAEIQDGLLKLFERAFRAWHGHSYLDVCPKCDPDGFKRLQELQRRRMDK